MQRHLMKSKIHRATITSADLHYEGSLTVDEDLLDAADLRMHEEVQVVNVNNGARFSTYVIPGPRGSAWRATWPSSSATASSTRRRRHGTRPR